VAQLLNGSNYFSDWAYSQFTIDVDAPATPLISAFYDTEAGAVTVTVFGRTNVLSANQASLETNTSGWVAVTNCAIARSTAQASTGSASLELTASASGDTVASTTTATKFAVEPNQDFSAIADFPVLVQHSYSTSRNSLSQYKWHNNFDYLWNWSYCYKFRLGNRLCFSSLTTYCYTRTGFCKSYKRWLG
jgi:hypothetical protein